jgi:hypothetical protein
MILFRTSRLLISGTKDTKWAGGGKGDRLDDYFLARTINVTLYYNERYFVYLFTARFRKDSCMRCIRFISFLSILSVSSFAQQSLQCSGGADLGWQNAWFDRWVVETPRIGLNFPVFITEEHGVQLSLRYSPKGFENDSGITYTSDWLNYLDIPLCYIYYPKYFPVELGVNIGVVYSILLGVSAKGLGGFEASPDKAYYSSSDYGITVGVHYRQPITYGALNFSIEYYGGIPTVRDTWPHLFEPEPDIRAVKNHALTFSIGYDLPRFGISSGLLSGGSGTK